MDEQRKVIIKVVGEIPPEFLEVTTRAGYRTLGGGSELLNYKTTLRDAHELGILLHEEYDLHLDAIPFSNNYTLKQGYRCPECNGLDLEPNLECVKMTGK